MTSKQTQVLRTEEALSVVDTLKLALEALKKSDDFLYNWHENYSDDEADAYAAARQINEQAIIAAEKALMSVSDGTQSEQVGINGLTEAETNATASVFGLVNAAPPYVATERQRKPLTDEQIDFLNFLYGAGEWDGVWFEGKHPTKKGAFWWRKDMKRLFDYGIKE